MSTGFQLLVNGIDVTPPAASPDSAAEWDATWEERVDGVGTASVTIQDRLNQPALNYGRERDIIEFNIPAMEGTFDHLEHVYRGEITRSRLELPAGRPWRRWKVSASDFNTVLDLRLVGAADGDSWRTIDGGQTFQTYDPEAFGQHTDRSTVQHLFDRYARYPEGPLQAVNEGKFQITFFVFNWIPRRIMYDRATGASHLVWTNTTLRSALDELRGLAGFPVFCWIDPAGYVHWEAFADPFVVPGPGLNLMRPHMKRRAAPAIVTDDSPDGVTSVGGRDLFMEYDASYMPEQAYVVGVTDFIHNGGSTVFQGTGWEQRHHADKTKRQLLVDAQATTEAGKDAVARHHTKYGLRARIKGSVTIGGPNEAVDGWRCGQMITIVDARLPTALNNRAWPILAVKGSLKAGNDFRVYTIEFGDAPIERFSQKYRATPKRIGTTRLPARTHQVIMPTTHLRPSTNYTLHSQMVDHSRKPVRQAGVPVAWRLIEGGGTVTAITTETDEHGRTAATLTTGGATGEHYTVRCTTVGQY